MELFTNDTGSYVLNPLNQQIEKTSSIDIASPYVTLTDEIHSASQTGKTVRLLLGLNASTSYRAISAIFNKPNIQLRYFTGKSHAKVYLFDHAALVGSSNLTEGGLSINREATILVSDPALLGDLREFFDELWEQAKALTAEVLEAFGKAVGGKNQHYPNPDLAIEKAIGKAEPKHSYVQAADKNSMAEFSEVLKRRVYGEYRPSFSEIVSIFNAGGLRRTEWESVTTTVEVNSFLGWLRETHAPGLEWQAVGNFSEKDRGDRILHFGSEWKTLPLSSHFDSQIINSQLVLKVMSSKDAIRDASATEIVEALTGTHAFAEQKRFVKGGGAKLGEFFWQANNHDTDRVKRSLIYLLHGNGDFIARLSDIVFNKDYKLRYFGEACATELCGTVLPDICPPVNGRSAKGLRFLGYQVTAH
jgi:HKD family nuclease